MHQAVETEKLEASENVAGGPVVQNHHHDEKQLLLGSIIFFSIMWGDGLPWVIQFCFVTYCAKNTEPRVIFRVVFSENNLEG